MLNIPGFPCNCIPEACGDIGLKNLGLVWAWKSGLKVVFMVYLPSANNSVE
jgi:hypothetical protein